MIAKTQIIPAFESGTSISVVFSVDENFIPHFSVALQSLIDTASTGNNYDIIVLEADITDRTKLILLDQVKTHKNISLRFYNMATLITSHEFAEWTSFSDGRFSDATYYRLFIPLIFKLYSKVLYLDADILIRKDVKELYDHDLGDNLLGAVQRNTTRYMRERYPNYFRVSLGFDDVSKYINSGVLLFNLPVMDKENTLAQFVETAKRDDLVDCDQAVLNLVCRDRILYIDPKWNAQWSAWFKPHLSDMSFEALDDLLVNSYILHFTVQKVTQATVRSSSYFGILWWQCARKTPFYEMLLLDDALRRSGKAGANKEKLDEQVVLERAFPVRLWLGVEKCAVRRMTRPDYFTNYLKNRSSFFKSLKNPAWRVYHSFSSLFFKDPK